MLLSEESMEKVNNLIDFPNDIIILFDEELPVKFSSSWHYCVTIGKVTDSNEKWVVQENNIFFK